ncbi:hypothetical protein CAI21_14535 [Alkalilimnicola ehrlichii]|uniref:Uncharacterized protein n=1 Tax=Alkalilimnicola ehrlichii TaxID=351052 RepID=A0A3E0WQC8_9GAMM|nr:hypothetical protein [Alkalilimnicola ehrlichii]RFA27259.1 hypothetical protein CAI21_14535 [Alkalilimnicola ehrlichii]RFA34371.1 hypothetical protein CAL65_15105 [Alkalilimnicola ehrlichii]
MESNSQPAQHPDSKRLFILVWVMGSAATVALLLAALFLGISWGWALGAFILATIGKWVARWHHRKQSRQLYVPALMQYGFTETEAEQAWEQAYYGGSDKLAEMRSKQGHPDS